MNTDAEFPIARKTDRIELGELAQAFLRQLNGKTLRAYKYDLERFAQWLELKDIDHLARELLADDDHRKANSIVLRWKNYMNEEGLSSSTLNRRLSSVRSLVRFAQMLGIVGWQINVPNEKKRGVRDTTGPGRSGMKKLLAELNSREDSPVTRRSKALVRLLFDVALRREEVSGIQMEDLDLGNSRLQILGKGRDKKEYVYIGRDVVTAILEWTEVREGGDQGALFKSFDPVGKGSGNLTGNSIYRIVKGLGRSAGVSITPHSLRHGGVTLALDKTHGDIRRVARFSRHEKLDTVYEYDDRRKDRDADISNLIGDSLREDD